MTDIFKPTAAHNQVRDALAEIARLEDRHANQIIINHLAEVDLGLGSGSSPKKVATYLHLTYIVGVCAQEQLYIEKTGIDPQTVTFYGPCYAVVTPKGFVTEDGGFTQDAFHGVQHFATEGYAKELAASIGGNVVDPYAKAVA